MRSAAPVTRNHLSKPEDLMLQNATPLRKSAPSSPNISDEHVSCTPPATENVSFQILFKRPTPAIVFGNATRPSRFAHCWKGAQSLRLPRKPTSERPKVLRTLSFLHFWLQNVLRATTAYTFSTPQLPKVLRSWRALYILTSKCASRHNGVHFFDASTSKSAPKLTCFVHFDLEMCFAPQRHFRSKSGPRMVCFVHVDLEMCFAPQRHALFRHLNFQKCSEADVFCTFWLGNVLRATTVCTFSTPQLPKVVRRWCVLCILTRKRVSRATFRLSSDHMAPHPPL